MKKRTPAITPASFEAMVSQWGRVAKFRESASIWYYNKSDLLWRFRNLLSNDKLYKKYFGSLTPHVIDLETELIDDPDEFFTIIDKQSSKSKDAVYFITGIDKELRGGNTTLLAAIMNRDAWRGRGSYLLFFTIDFTHPQFRTLFGPVSTSIQNVIIHPLHSKGDTIGYIRHQSQAWGFTIPDAFAQTIQAECGGHFLLVKEAVRYLRDHPRATTNNVLTHQEMRWRVEIIWNHFLPSEQEALHHTAQGTMIIDDGVKHSQAFLVKAGYITDSKKPSLTIPLLFTYIQSQIKGQRLELREQQRIYANGICINESLPRKERILLRHFLEHQQEIISRDAIGTRIGKGDYSDWAIDQLVYRLRKSLARFNIPPTMIKTVYGKGFRFLPNNT